MRMLLIGLVAAAVGLAADPPQIPNTTTLAGTRDAVNTALATMQTSVDAKAPLATPTFTGYPTMEGLILGPKTIGSGANQLPAAATCSGCMTVVTDAASTSDCTVGSGSSRSLCRSTGSAWEAIGGGGGSTGTCSAGQYVSEVGAGSITCGTPATGVVADLSPTKTSSSVLTIAAGRYGVGNVTVSHVGSALTIQSLTVSGASNASPIILTVNDFTGYSIRNGDTMVVSGVGGNTAANGTWIVEIVSTTQLRLLASTGNGAYTSGGTVAGDGTGTMVVYATADGNIHYDFTASSGLIASCTGSCVMNQVTTPTLDANAIPIASVSIDAGALDALTDENRIRATRGVAAGTGVSISDAAGVATVGIDYAVVPTKGGTNSFTGSNSFSAATRTAPNKVGTSLPATCTVGDTYFKSDSTAGQNLHLCTATNTWTQVTTESKRTWYPAGGYFSGGATVGPLYGSGSAALITTSGGIQIPTIYMKVGASAFLHHVLQRTESTVTIRMTLTQVDQNGGGNGNWQYDVSAACVAASATLDPSLGTVVSVDQAAPDMRTRGVWSATVTPSGTCSAGSHLIVKMARNGGTDTAWAMLVGVEVVEP